jgi:hypothetical protein
MEGGGRKEQRKEEELCGRKLVSVGILATTAITLTHIILTITTTTKVQQKGR